MPRLGILSIALTAALTAVLLGLPQVSRETHSTTTHEDEVVDLDRRLQQLETENAALREALREIEDLRGELESLRARDPREVPLLERFPIPDEVEFCGERLPLERADVRARFEDEWVRFLVNRHWLISWNRRVEEVFPLVEERLAAAGLPDDLKYVLVIESGVRARATSSAGAAGWWQFIRSTGERYGLRRNRHLDERRDLALSTDGATRYFSDLHEEFGDWPLVLSAYNAGERRVREALEEQGESSFYDLVLPSETEAYWFKAAVAKTVLSDPARFGLPRPASGAERTVCDTLRIELRRSKTPLREIAAAAGISYRRIKELNPSIRTSWLPRGEHRLLLPSDAVDLVVADVKGLKVKHRATGSAAFAERDGR